MANQSNKILYKTYSNKNGQKTPHIDAAAWTWEENSILYNISEHASPRDIFQAVCNELGRYYTIQGGKYTKSNRKLKWSGNKIRCELVFWSSHSNIQGKWVNLEIVTSVYALDAKEMERKGILNFGPYPKNFNVYKIDHELFAEIIEYIDSTLEMVWSFETKEGLNKYLADTGNKYRNDNPNDAVYYNLL